MKKTLVSLAVIAAALTGCSKTESFNDTLPKNQGMNFGSYVDRTKAQAMDLTALQTTGFNIWAYETTTDATPGLNAPIETAAVIKPHLTLKGDNLFKWDDGTSFWVNDPLTSHYWPQENLGEVSFYAISGGVDAFTAPAVATPTTDASFTYTIKDEANQEDLIAAQLYNKTLTEENQGVVNFDFKHLLTQVRFSAKSGGTDYAVKILKIKIIDAVNEGLFTFNMAATAVDPIGAWTPTAASTTDYTYFDATPGGVDEATFPIGFPAGTDNTNFFTSDKYDAINLNGSANAERLILLPATTLKGVSIEVTYQIYVLNEDVTPVYVADGALVTNTIELTDLLTWDMNKQVVYQLTLFQPAAGKIVYNPVVTDWAPEEGNEYKPE